MLLRCFALPILILVHCISCHANDLAKGYLKNRRRFQPRARMRCGWRQFGETEKWFEAPMNDDVDLCGAEVFILQKRVHSKRQAT